MIKKPTQYELTSADILSLRDYLTSHGFSLRKAPISVDIIDATGVKKGRILGQTLGAMPLLNTNSVAQLQVYEDEALENLVKDFYKQSER